MNMITKTETQNTRRLKYMKLEATSFEEELILHYIYHIIHTGGEITMEPSDASYPANVADFTGEGDS